MQVPTKTLNIVPTINNYLKVEPVKFDLRGGLISEMNVYSSGHFEMS